jgi:hypothetical protein
MFDAAVIDDDVAFCLVHICATTEQQGRSGGERE